MTTQPADIPGDVQARLLETYPGDEEMRELFTRLWTSVKLRCADAKCRTTQRYIGFHRERSIFAYVDPQQASLEIGVFANHVNRLQIKSLLIKEYPDWNESKGGLVGMCLMSRNPEIVQFLEACYGFA
jgi:predicted transport protein